MTALNRLAGAGSLYLRQHAGNPIAWQPWDDAALNQAQREDKPIFLSIGYAACHWCHVMEREVFTDADVAALLNQDFVAIKVDREEQPAVDATYMAAVQALTGSGGWPLNVFLTPDRKPFFGGTYVPRDRFLALLARVRSAFRDQRAELERDAASVAAWVETESALPPAGDLEQALVRFRSLVSSGADRQWGGLSGQQKFPLPVLWRTLLHLTQQHGDADAAALLRLTLDQMAAGGIHDQLAGGFHRYTVEPTWTVPHFEKMLYDNAQLASLYFEAAAAQAEPRWAAVGADTLDFMLRDLSGSEGACYASLDADSDGAEGRHYLWTQSELVAIAGLQDGSALAALLGVTAAGDLDGRSVLTRRADPIALAGRFDRSPAELTALFDSWRPVLRAARSNRPAPMLDRKVVSAWNGLAIEALARGSLAVGDARYAAAARRAVDFLRRVHRRDDGALWRSSTAGRVEGAGVLDDYAQLATGLLWLYQASRDADLLTWALELIEQARARFARPAGGWYLTADDVPTPLGRQLELTDHSVPSGNSALLAAMQLAGALGGDHRLLDEVERTLAHFAGAVAAAPLDHAGWLDVALRQRAPWREVVSAGDRPARDVVCVDGACLPIGG